MTEPSAAPEDLNCIFPLSTLKGSNPITKKGPIAPAILIVLWSLAPFYWLLNISFQATSDMYTIPANLFPPRPTLDNYLIALGVIKTSSVSAGGLGLVPAFLSGIGNSTIVASLVMALSLLLCIPAGYAFARFSFPLRTTVFFLILFARSLPPISASIPYYQFYKEIGLLGTIPGLVFAHMTLTVPLTTWVLSGFFSSLPIELDRQARIDGCSRLKMFTKVIIPIAAPGLAAVGILAWLTSWNEFIFALLLGYVKDLYTIAPAVASPIIGATVANPTIFATFTSISVIPAIIAAIILQRYMTRLRIVDPLTFRAPA